MRHLTHVVILMLPTPFVFLIKEDQFRAADYEIWMIGLFYFIGFPEILLE
jgi:hypothetical protein